MKLSVLRITLGAFFGFLLLGVFLPLLASFGALAFSFLFGWISFLRRVGSEVTVNWSGVGMVVLCSILIVAGIHSLSTWLFGSITSKSRIGGGLRWRFSWTLATFAALWLLFAAIMGAVGAAHQIGWLLRSGEPIYKPRQHLGMFRSLLRARATTLFVCAEEASWNFEKTRKKFLGEQSKWVNDRQNALDEFHFVLFEGTNGSLVAGFVFHRDPETRAKAGFVAISAETPPGEIQPVEKLSSALARYQPNAGIAPVPR